MPLPADPAPSPSNMTVPDVGDILSVIHILAIHLPLCNQCVDDQRSFRVRQSVDVLEFAQLQLSASFFVALDRLALSGRGCWGCHRASDEKETSTALRNLCSCQARQVVQALRSVVQSQPEQLAIGVLGSSSKYCKLEL